MDTLPTAQADRVWGNRSLKEGRTSLNTNKKEIEIIRRVRRQEQDSIQRLGEHEATSGKGKRKVGI